MMKYNMEVRKVRKSILFVTMATLLWAVSCSAGNFGIKINDVSGLNSPWPIIASIPFSEGELNNVSTIRIMNGAEEVPSQVDITATWRDGSIRWALAGFTASPQGNYRVEFGENIKRGTYPNPLKVTELSDGGFEVNTGVAVYRFEKDKLLPEEGWLISGADRVQILKNSGAGTYLIDNSGRQARVAGETAQIISKVLKKGPNRLVIKRSGWYVTDTGEKLAGADVWLYFTAGVPHIKVTHSLIFILDTNKVWFKDYGLEFKTPNQPTDTYFGIKETGNSKDVVNKVSNQGDETYMLQSDYPHFLEREYKGFLGKSNNGNSKVVTKIKTAGDWGYGDYNNYGIVLAMPWLAERFPKEISFGQNGAKAVLWSARSGKELDFRSETVFKDYFETWGKSYRPSWGGSAKNIAEIKSNAQGCCRTHDIWFIPTIGTYNPEKVMQTATAASKEILAIAEPEWICKSEAMGYPMLHKDTDQFPVEEKLISELWDRLEIPMRAFPVTGFLAWGITPCRYGEQKSGKAVMAWNSFFPGEYGMKRETWRHYARSGERRYFDLGYRFSNFTGDWSVVRFESPGKKKGTIIEARYVPFPWGDRTSVFVAHGGDIGHWLYDYYFTGNERSRDILNSIQDSFDRNSKGSARLSIPMGFLAMRTLLTTAIIDWNPVSVQRSINFTRGLIDLKSQNGIRLTANGTYGAEYKDHRASHNFLEYYLETKDELGKEAFLKTVDQRYRFDRRTSAISYKNYDAFTYSLAYWLTGEEKYRGVVEQTLRDIKYYSSKYPLSKDLAGMPKDPLDWKNLPPHLGSWEWHNPLIGLPTALKLISDKGWSGKVSPLVVKPMNLVEGKVLFNHIKGKDTSINIFMDTLSEQPNLEVLRYPVSNGDRPLSNVRIETEKRMPTGSYFLKAIEDYEKVSQNIYASIVIPAETNSGLYLLSIKDEDSFTVLDSTATNIALYCPEGFWSVSGGRSSYGRSSEGVPLFFSVPEGLKNLDILLTRPATIRRPDNSVALGPSLKNIGTVSIPINGNYGVWSIETVFVDFKGKTPTYFYKLLNIDSIISFGSPKYLPEVTINTYPTPPAKPQFSSKTFQFTDGLDGKALRLSGAKEQKLSFPCGDKLLDDGFTFLPGKTGTIEFWYRSDNTTYEIPLPENVRRDYQYFLRGPGLGVSHSYYARANIRNLYSNIRLEFFSDKSKNSISGREGEHFFKEGEWVHFAYVWDIKEGAKKMEGKVNIFVNGKQLPLQRPLYGIKQFPDKGVFQLSESEKRVTVGPFAGSIDMLRVSDTARYTQDFVPSKTAPKVDKNTRALFLFDGNLEGVSAFSTEQLKLN